MAKLEQDVQDKVKNYLTSQGKNIDDLTEGQLTELYWNVISENIEEEEKTTVTSYDLTDDNDSAKFNDELDSVDPEKINVGDGAATIEEDELIEVEKSNVMKFDLKSGQDVQALQQMLDKGIDSEKLTVGTDGTISLSEADIRSVIVSNQNPIMSKSELIREMRSQILNEDNKYQDEYSSGENDYSKHLDVDSINSMGQELFNDIKSAAEQKFGGEANFDRASMEMSRSIMNIFNFEQGRQEELAQEAIRLIREEYPALTEDMVDIDAEITGHPGLPGGRPINKGNVQLEKGNTPPPEGYTEEELKDEVIKRRLINGMTHGAARKGQNLYHMATDKLREINPNATQDYSKVMAANDFLYWAMDKNQVKQQSSEGIHAGNVRVVIQESGKPKIVAQGMTFSFLLHELTKGVYELQSLHGRHEEKEVNDYIEDKTDTLEAEPDDIRLGTGIWEKVSRFVDIENDSHKSLFYHKLITKPASEFVEIMRGLMKGDRNMVERVQNIADEASEDLRQEEYDDAMGTYDEKPEETPPTEDDGFPDPEKEDDGQYSDPLLNDLMSGSSQQDEPSGEIDYSTMSKPDLQRAMDDALDSGDLVLAGKIGPYLH
jgi:hypothetical protein